jgi:hypothetical protein
VLGRRAVLEAFNTALVATVIHLPLPRHLREDLLGYSLHTNRELGMMLRGLKPLAVFSEVDGAFVEPLARYIRMFERHVQTGRFTGKRHIEPLSPGDAADSHSAHLVLFALPAEAWRIDAMIELRRNLKDWTAARERAEGTLLGYADWQNDAWIANRYGQG